ncbi:exosome complex protein Rrp42 [Candidatus Pacearchaeota archaeon]|nr:exosome complex protein Rrp42 [Candidatus Pacearchaeota archaeon]
MKLTNINRQKIIDLLKDDKRLDNRKPFEYRDIEIDTNISINAEGTARVKIGKTEVIVGVKMDTQEPYPDHEDEGTMITGMEFSPMSGDRYENGPPQMDSIEVARVVDRGIRESRFVDWKKLCIKEGEKVWSIMIDIYCINDEGNVMDASAIGAVAALKMARFPKYDKENESVVHGEFTDTPLPLTEHIPFTMTFHKIGNKLLLDPNRNEEDSSEAKLTLSVSQAGKKDKMINSMQKGGIIPITSDEMEKIITEAEKAYDKVFPDIEKKIGKLKR